MPQPLEGVLAVGVGTTHGWLRGAAQPGESVQCTAEVCLSGGLGEWGVVESEKES